MKKTAASALVLALAVPAAADEVDLSAVLQRAQDQAAATTGRIQKRYAALARALSKPDVPGLGDDLARLAAAASACQGPLSSDAELCSAVGSALTFGRVALQNDGAAVVTSAAALDAPADRTRCGKFVATAQSLSDRATLQQMAGKPRACIAHERKAASALAKGAALAAKLLARQNRRPPSWSVPLDGLGGALLSVWVEPGASPGIYTVGADDGTGPLFLLTHGEDWVRVPVASSGTLWWVSPIQGAMWASGTHGMVVRYDPSTAEVTSRPTGVDATYYGVWGAAEDDVWAVGGNLDGTDPRTAFSHWNGSAWSDVTLPAEAANKTLFKVWGSSASDVWACGQGGLLLHFDGVAWSAVPSSTSDPLFTVNGASPTIAVGGSVSAVIVERPLQDWVSATLPASTQTLRGVFVPAHGDAIACGLSGTVLRRSGGTWARLAPPAAAASNDFHATYVDDAGGVYLVGGDLLLLQRGALVYYGPRRLPSGVYPQAKLSTDVATIFSSPTCAVGGCHVSATPSGGLDLYADSHTIRSRLVDVPSTESPLFRVLAGRPSQSYLWHKVLGSELTVGGSGARMPTTGNYLTPPEEDLLRAWILEGARDN